MEDGQSLVMERNTPGWEVTATVRGCREKRGKKKKGPKILEVGTLSGQLTVLSSSN